MLLQVGRDKGESEKDDSGGLKEDIGRFLDRNRRKD